jgi:hypothetical protein
MLHDYHAAIGSCAFAQSSGIQIVYLETSRVLTLPDIPMRCSVICRRSSRSRTQGGKPVYCQPRPVSERLLTKCEVCLLTWRARTTNLLQQYVLTVKYFGVYWPENTSSISLSRCGWWVLCIPGTMASVRFALWSSRRALNCVGHVVPAWWPI